MERANGGQALRDRAAGVAAAQLGEVGAKLRTWRAAPVHVAVVEPAQIRADGRRVGPLRVRRGIARGEAAEEALERGVGRLAGRPVHSSAVGSEPLGGEPVPRAPPFRDEPPRPRPDRRILGHSGRSIHCGRRAGVPAQTGRVDRPCSGHPARCRPGRHRSSTRTSGRSRHRPCGRSGRRPCRAGRRAAGCSS